MRKRWVPYFLGMIAQMEQLGKLGSSRTLAFFADGDGDYRPEFEFSDDAVNQGRKELLNLGDPTGIPQGLLKVDYFYDAG